MQLYLNFEILLSETIGSFYWKDLPEVIKTINPGLKPVVVLENVHELNHNFRYFPERNNCVFFFNQHKSKYLVNDYPRKLKK